MKETYIYPAIFDYASDGISVSFPDLPGCFTCGDNDEEAIKNAKEAMALHIAGMEDDGDVIPEPTPISKVKLEDNQIVVPIEVWMPYYRSGIKTVYVKKTLTIPSWLNSVAERSKINFSQVLQEALKEKLGIREYKQ
ncbi:type II toxin-antitoxin system HicB family antitoxin [Thermoanaerobacterium sp. CMT5567-10]|uniref:type II toxin-antitoxin system HicB family antitoxin n=1 Tax=Thermoanaerobacterium sp. CMT5567-10 TaxID=3061989 RepID=UPI0026DEED4A|nr:type II toxin-antitoxin system HicB family antitoxin [Thermoanaerobacterium sp. CMT5567-10]WKV08468.1 type II toxin-antitoxin system HicB family antitoxin [Thermoanaerobacterium sp. CMT5567-10]